MLNTARGPMNDRDRALQQCVDCGVLLTWEPCVCVCVCVCVVAGAEDGKFHFGAREGIQTSRFTLVEAIVQITDVEHNAVLQRLTQSLQFHAACSFVEQLGGQMGRGAGSWSDVAEFCLSTRFRQQWMFETCILRLPVTSG